MKDSSNQLVSEPSIVVVGRALSDYTSHENSECGASPMGVPLESRKGISDPLTKLTEALLRSSEGGSGMSLFDDQQRQEILQ